MKVTTDSCLFGAWVANDIKGLAASNNILDIGTGSGLLSMMLAQKTNAIINGVEIQENDYLQSLQNIAASSFKERIFIHHTDVLNYTFPKKYDIIISNPPFYESDLKGNEPGKNIAHHDEGLKLHQLYKLIQQLLTVDGYFYLLLPAKRIADTERLIIENGLHINTMIHIYQTEKHAPFRTIIKGSFKQTVHIEEHIYIKTGNTYSTAFTYLLSDYYLHL